MELKLFNKLYQDIFGNTGLDTSNPMTQRLIEEYSKDLGLDTKIFNEIKKRVKQYNRLINDKISLRYYQILALYFTEKYFRDYYNKTYSYKMLAYWMATGSGKTILMHINILQYLSKLKKFDRVQIILTTPGVNLINQHRRELVPFINELNKEYNNKIDLLIETTGSLLQSPENYFNLPENSKTKRIILVDEGHIGLSASNEGKFKQLREEMNSNESFLFEYSATYHHLNNQLKEDYEKTIVYDYNYKLFYKDGYGKAYSFKEINPDIMDGEKDNLDETFTVFEDKLDIFNNFNLYAAEEARSLFGARFPDKPLLAFMGNTVSNITDEGKNDEVSDISKVILYLASLSTKEREKYKNVFNNEIHGKLRLTSFNNVDDEILLSFGDGEYWGIINVGNGDNFFNSIADPKIEKRSILIMDNKYLFENIDYAESPINVLIGSRKFAEGWNSFRVSVIGLINLGSSKGNKIIQIFGRGVRLKGVNNDGKRTFHERTDLPNYDDLDNENEVHLIRKLETLNVFSLKRSYLETFIDEVSKEIEYSHTMSIEVSPSLVKLGTGTKLAFNQFNDKLPIFKLSKKDVNHKKVIINDGEVIYSYFDELSEHHHHLKQVKFTLDYRNNKYTDEKNIILDIKNYLGDYYSLLNVNEVQSLIEEVSFENSLQLYSLDNQENLVKCSILDLLELVAEIRVSKKDIEYSIEKVENIVYNSINDIIQKLRNKINYNINSRNYTFNNPITQQKSPNDRDGDIIYEYKVTSSFDTYEEKVEFLKDVENQRKQIKSNLELSSDFHIYEPILMEDSNLTISPDYLNRGEVKFFRDINNYISNHFNGNDKYEFYLLRNVESLKSIGIYLENDEGVYFPDFILWVENKIENKTNIIFFDPKGQKGIVNEDTLQENDKVQLGARGSGNNQLEELEKILQEQYNKEIEVHSYILLRDSSEFGKEISRSSKLEDINWVQDNLVSKNILRLDWHKYDEKGNTSKLFNNNSYLDLAFKKLNIL